MCVLLGEKRPLRSYLDFRRRGCRVKWITSSAVSTMKVSLSWRQSEQEPKYGYSILIPWYNQKSTGSFSIPGVLKVTWGRFRQVTRCGVDKTARSGPNLAQGTRAHVLVRRITEQNATTRRTRDRIKGNVTNVSRRNLTFGPRERQRN